MSRDEIQRKFDEIVAFAEVEQFLDTPVKRYSSGMYVRLAFAIAAHLEPEILIVDEVLAVGDAQFQKKCLGKMREIGQEGRTVIFVSHNLTAIRSLCDRAILVDSGKLVTDGKSEDVISKYTESFGRNTLVNKWTDLVAPHNHSAKVYEARIEDSKGEISPEITCDTPFQIDIDFEVFEPNTSVGFTFILNSEEGQSVFSSINNHEPEWHGRTMPKGKYTTSCHIPGQFLNNGWYNLTFNMFGKTFSDIYNAQDVLRFNVQDGSIVRGDYFGDYSGVVRPLLNWRTKRW